MFRNSHAANFAEGTSTLHDNSGPVTCGLLGDFVQPRDQQMENMQEPYVF